MHLEIEFAFLRGMHCPMIYRTCEHSFPFFKDLILKKGVCVEDYQIKQVCMYHVKLTKFSSPTFKEHNGVKRWRLKDQQNQQYCLALPFPLTLLWPQQTVWLSCWSSMFNGVRPEPTNKRFNSAYLQIKFLICRKTHSNTF